MSELIHQADSYVRDFEATVVEGVGDGVVLDRTAFYATSGGQPHDEGTLTHRLAGGTPPVGARVRRRSSSATTAPS